jgi:hypothetical protein
MKNSMRVNVRYPRLLLFLVSVIVVYFLFSGVLYEPLHEALLVLGYLGTFLAGLLYPYSFTSVAGTAILLVLAQNQNIFLAGVIAGIGALISDLAIFCFVKYSFGGEVQQLSQGSSIKTLNRVIPARLRTPLFVVLACVLIASPLPTEIGIMLLTSVKKLSLKQFLVLVYLLHLSAIFVILFIGQKI